MEEFKPFADLYPDKIVGIVVIGDRENPTIVIATERNIFEIIEGKLELVKFKVPDDAGA